MKFLLTSGSTGQPKAVITTERMCCSNAAMLHQAMPFLRDEPPVLVDWLPWNHTFGGSHNVGLVLFNGGTLYIDDGKPTPAGFAETIRNLREISPTVYFNVPKGFEMLAPSSARATPRCVRRSIGDCMRTSLRAHRWRSTPGTRSIARRSRERGVRDADAVGARRDGDGSSVTFTTPPMGRGGVIGLPAAGAHREARAGR